MNTSIKPPENMPALIVAALSAINGPMNLGPHVLPLVILNGANTWDMTMAVRIALKSKLATVTPAGSLVLTAPGEGLLRQTLLDQARSEPAVPSGARN